MRFHIFIMFKITFQVTNIVLFYKLSNMTIGPTSLYSYMNTWNFVRKVGATAKQSGRKPSPEVVVSMASWSPGGFDLFLVFFQHPTCLYKSTKTWELSYRLNVYPW